MQGMSNMGMSNLQSGKFPPSMDMHPGHNKQHPNTWMPGNQGMLWPPILGQGGNGNHNMNMVGHTPGTSEVIGNQYQMTGMQCNNMDLSGIN